LKGYPLHPKRIALILS